MGLQNLWVSPVTALRTLERLFPGVDDHVVEQCLTCGELLAANCMAKKL